MAYASQANCVDRYGEDAVIVATDRDNTGSIDTTVLGKALGDADAKINSYVAGLPGYPFDPAPDVFEQIAVDLAMYFAARPATAATKEQKDRYDDAIKYLTAVGKQQIRLPYDDGDQFIEPNSTAEVIHYERVFTRTQLNKVF